MLGRLTISFLILIAGCRATSKLECVLGNLRAALDVTVDTRRHIAARINDMDLGNKVEENSKAVNEKMLPFDFASAGQMEEMLAEFKNQAPEFQAAVNKCKLSMQSTIAICEKKFGACENVDSFSVSKKCPEGFVRFNYAYCVPVCGSQGHPVKDDVFLCAKVQQSARSGDIPSDKPSHPLNYKGVVEVARCPEGFTDLHNDICIANCPYGWEDLGAKCLKPYFEEREYQIFSYQFQNDRDQIIVHTD